MVNAESGEYWHGAPEKYIQLEFQSLQHMRTARRPALALTIALGCFCHQAALRGAQSRKVYHRALMENGAACPCPTVKELSKWCFQGVVRKGKEPGLERPDPPSPLGWSFRIRKGRASLRVAEPFQLLAAHRGRGHSVSHGSRVPVGSRYSALVCHGATGAGGHGTALSTETDTDRVPPCLRRADSMNWLSSRSRNINFGPLSCRPLL